MRLFTILSLALFLSSSALADTVRKENGVQTGTISQVSKTSVQLTSGGSSEEIPVNEILEVTFDSEPFAVKTARRAIQNGQYEDAIDKLKSVEEVSNENANQEIAFIRAYSLGKLAMAGAAEKQKAVDALLDFVKKSPNSFHFYEVARLLGDLAVSTGDYAGAEKYYGALASAPWPDYRMQALNLEGRALLAQNKSDEAIKRFDEVLATQASVTGIARQKSFASVGKAEALGQKNQPKEGITLAKKVIENGDPTDIELFGRAYNALGRCHLQLKDQKEALLAYLHTDILFATDPEIHAEALYNLASIWKGMSKTDEAAQARNMLNQRYPGSAWANMQ